MSWIVKFCQILVLVHCVISFCGIVQDAPRRCSCRKIKEVKCLSANLVQLPEIEPAYRAHVKSLILRLNYIRTIDDFQLEGYSQLQRLDVRMQLTDTCVVGFLSNDYNIWIQGICEVSCC